MYGLTNQTKVSFAVSDDTHSKSALITVALTKVPVMIVVIVMMMMMISTRPCVVLFVSAPWPSPLPDIKEYQTRCSWEEVGGVTFDELA